MKTIKLIAIMTLLTSLFASCDDNETYYGSKNVITEDRSVETFTKINSSGVFDITISQGSNQKVEITADDNILNKLKTKVSNGTLNIYLEDVNYKNITVSIDITVNELTKVVNEGTGTIEAIGFKNNTTLDIFNSGNGFIYFEGNTINLNIENQGSGEIDCMNLISENSSVHIEGSGDCHLNVEKEVKGKIEGSASIYYIGSPIIDVDVDGSGQVVKVN